MKYPNITLQIKSNKPVIIYYSSEDSAKNLTDESENLEEIILALAKRLNLPEDNIQDLLQLCEYGVERLIEDLPKRASRASQSFEIEKLIENKVKKLIEGKEDYSSYEDVNKEVLAELNRNQNTDIFASAVELIYNILIAKTLYHAQELGIGTIYYEDENDYVRLKSKMAGELGKMDIELLFKD